MSVPLEPLLERLSLRHRAALEWFLDKRGSVGGWPQPLAVPGVPEPTLLAAKAKGIYKPQWSLYALSVREMLKSPYNDQPPVEFPDGSWTYRYFQEGYDLENPAGEYTNQGLFHCLADTVPVGVFRQVTATRPVQYEYRGLALVTDWRAGWFTLSSFSEGRKEVATDVSAHGVRAALTAVAPPRETPPRDEKEGRDRILASVRARRGQGNFRAGLLAAYDGRCAVTRTRLPAVVEAAHITPYDGPRTNNLNNGLLLRADLHTLFDLGLFAVDPDSRRVIIDPELQGTPYEPLATTHLLRPVRKVDVPSAEHLDRHRAWAGLG